MPASRSSARWQVALFLLLLVTYGYFIQPSAANALSRYDLVRALVDDHSLTIDRYQQNTVDKGLFDGHYYSDKAFGLSVLAAPVYAALRLVDNAAGIPDRDDQQTIALLTLVTVSVPSALLAVLVARLGILLGFDGLASLLAGLAYGLGTIAFPFATLFFGHQTSTFAAFAAGYLLISLRRSGRQAYGRALAAGALAGSAALIEYPVGLVAVVLAGYLWLFVPDRRFLVAFLLGIVPALLALAAYNHAAFGDFARLSYIFVNDQRFAEAHRGLMGVSWPDPLTALQLVFAGKGLLTNAPILALVPLGLWRLWRRPDVRPELALCLAVALAFLLYNAGYYLPFGGWTPGPRFLLPALPFLAVPLGAASGQSARTRFVFIGLTIWSALVMFLATATTPTVSDVKRIPLFDVWLPDFLGGDLVYNLGMRYFGLHGPASLVPLVLALAVAAALWPLSPAVVRRARGRLATATAVAPALILLVLPLSLPLAGGGQAIADPHFVVDETAPSLAVVSPGQEQVVTVSVRNGSLPAHNVVLWLSVEDSSGATRFEDWAYPVNLDPNQQRRFVFHWTVPRDESSGDRRVMARVLHPSWSYDLGHTEDVVSFAVVADGR